jgi:RNA polymerase sigma-70 factor, ECF subfamily
MKSELCPLSPSLFRKVPAIRRSQNKFMNKTASNPVFTIEGRRVVAGEAILSGASVIGDSRDETSKGTRIQAEDIDETLAVLVREHSRLVYRIAYAALRQHQDAEDATQETFLRVLRYRSRLAGVDDPKTWLARIAWRVAVDRSGQRQANEISIEDVSSAAEPASAEAFADVRLEGTQVGAVLEKMIRALPKKLRQPLILSTVEEMSPREIAAILAISEAAVRSRVFRARQILKEKLAGRLGSRG